MSDTVIISIVTAATSLVAACIAGYVAYKIEGIKHQLNSMRDQENATNRKLGNKEGVLQEKKDQETKTSL